LQEQQAKKDKFLKQNISLKANQSLQDNTSNLRKKADIDMQTDLFDQLSTKKEFLTKYQLEPSVDYYFD